VEDRCIGVFKEIGMKVIMPLVTILIVIFTSCAAETKLDVGQDDNVKIYGNKVIENLLARNDYMLYNNQCLHYSEACTAVGALRFAQKIGNKELIDRIIRRYDKLLEDKNIFISREPHVDHSVVGILPLQIYIATGDERYLKLGLTFADSQWENPREDGLTRQTRWWIDDMYMVGMLQMQAYRLTKEIKYADRAALQISAYLKKLQQPNGLFFHGPDFHFFWGRGNGWVAAAMAEVLKSLPADHKLHPEIMIGYKKMMSSLLKYQSDNGMWRQLIDNEYSWAESSCTAMFAYAMAVGIKNGWLDEKEYGAAVAKAFKALCAHVDREGNVREVCVGTGQKDDIEYYLKRPRTVGDFHGQAPFLWLASEIIDRTPARNQS
jgi:unsaturated rhamnogalacturonyl hydrolase